MYDDDKQQPTKSSPSPLIRHSCWHSSSGLPPLSVTNFFFCKDIINSFKLFKVIISSAITCYYNILKYSYETKVIIINIIKI